MEENSICLEFIDVSYDFPEVSAINNISFNLRKKELICFLGDSGCGKTTLLRIAAGLEKPKSGTIKINKKIVANDTIFTPPDKRNIGLMFQDFALFPHLSVLENVMFGLSKIDKNKAIKKAMETLELVGMSKFYKSFPYSLSGGEQQRIALARALAPEPKILLMDEPFSSMDQRLREQIRTDTITILREYGASCIMVTHDPSEALHLSDRIALMRKGKIIQIGTSKDLYFSPKNINVANFFCSSNEIEGIVKNGEIITPLFSFKNNLNFPENKKVKILIRPQGFISVDKGTIEGSIISSHFIGYGYLTNIKIPKINQKMQILSQNEIIAPPHNKIFLELDKKHLFIFPN